MASLTDTRGNRKISCQKHISVWLNMMSGHGANPIFCKDWTSRTLATPHPLHPITSQFCLTPLHPPVKVDVICVPPLTLLLNSSSLGKISDSAAVLQSFFKDFEKHGWYRSYKAKAKMSKQNGNLKKTEAIDVCISQSYIIIFGKIIWKN